MKDFKLRNYTDDELKKMAGQLSTMISNKATDYSFDGTSMGYNVDLEKSEKIIKEFIKDKNLTDADARVLSIYLNAKTQKKNTVKMTGNAIWKIVLFVIILGIVVTILSNIWCEFILLSKNL